MEKTTIWIDTGGFLVVIVVFVDFLDLFEGRMARQAIFFYSTVFSNPWVYNSPCENVLNTLHGG